MNINKFKIGSQSLCLNCCKDIDYVIISNEYDYKKMVINGEDIIYRSTQNLISHFTFNGNNIKLYIYNYQYDRDIIGKEFPIEYHLLDYKQQLVDYLKLVVKNKMFNFNKRIKINKLYCSKQLYHVAYNMFICQNNSVVLTEEQKEVIQKLHDKVMPISYLDEMEKIINNL